MKARHLVAIIEGLGLAGEVGQHAQLALCAHLTEAKIMRGLTLPELCSAAWGLSKMGVTDTSVWTSLQTALLRRLDGTHPVVEKNSTLTARPACGLARLLRSLQVPNAVF